MADTRRLRIGKAIENALNVTTVDSFTKPEGFVAHRLTHVQQEKDDHPGAVVYDNGNIERTDRGGDLVEDKDEFVVLIRALGAVGTAPDDTIDPYFSWVTQAIMADVTLGGECSKVTMGDREPAIPQESERLYISMIQRIEVIYQTNRSDPEADQ